MQIRNGEPPGVDSTFTRRTALGGLLAAVLTPTNLPADPQQNPTPFPGITIPIIVGGNQVGTIIIYPQVSGGGLSGGFKPNPGTTMPQLEGNLGQDHMNWFQVVTGGTGGPINGNVTYPYVDPPCGGTKNNPADKQPWYWDEPPYGNVIPPTAVNNPNLYPNNPNAPHQPLSNTGPTYISIGDGPQRPVPGSGNSFDIFLISIFKDGTYQPLGGFTWTVIYGPGGTATVVTVTPWTGLFPPAYGTLIGQFPNNPYTSPGAPWKIHPAPPAPAPPAPAPPAPAPGCGPSGCGP